MARGSDLGRLLKSARDVMRKDKGLNGDLDRLPILTWIMFLKLLDDSERIREQEAEVSRSSFRPAIEAPYRWRDWGSREEGLTGEDLLRFINNDECVRPDGSRGPGLFTYLRSLQGDGPRDRREVIATVFRGLSNRMTNGYLLREVTTKVNGIHFDSTEETHLLSEFYETMLRELRDAAGDSGEFYTPRPVVRLMAAVVNPRIGEVVLDPACGTGGFLVETYLHLMRQASTVEDFEVIQSKSLFGGEAKPLPYLLAQMNMLLHGIDSPNIDPGNSLRFPLSQIGERDRVDVILTNPPFGGEEEAGILANFPEDRRTNETALLFLQLIMRKLRRTPRPGRAAVVVPNGVLFGDGLAARLREELLREFNLHTIVRLPLGVFAPYTPQPTNLLFFDRGGPTKGVWFYEHPLPEGAKTYTKTRRLQFEELQPCLEWWSDRVETDCAWYVPRDGLDQDSLNLDLRNPRGPKREELRNPGQLEQLLGDAVAALSEESRLMHDFVSLSQGLTAGDGARWPVASLGEWGFRLNPESRNPEAAPNQVFRYVDLSSVSFGAIHDVKTLKGVEAPSRARRVMHAGDIVFATVRPYLRGHAVVPAELDGEICSTGFSVIECPTGFDPRFVFYMLVSPQVIAQCEELMRGSHYPALNEEHVKKLRIPQPPEGEQLRIVELLDTLVERAAASAVSSRKAVLSVERVISDLVPSILRNAYSPTEDH